MRGDSDSDSGSVGRLRSFAPRAARIALVSAVMAVSVSWAQGGAAAQSDFNPVAGDAGFLAFVQGGAGLYTGSDDGGLAVGGDLTPGGSYSLGSDVAGGSAGGTGLLVGGGIRWPSDPEAADLTVSSGDVVLGHPDGSAVARSPSGEIRVESGARDGLRTPAPRPSPVDFAAAFDAFRDRSAALARCSSTLALTDANGAALPTAVPSGTAAFLKTVPGTVNILDIPATELARLNSVTFQHDPDSSGPLIVDVDTAGVGDDFAWTPPRLLGAADADARYILYNFATARHVAVEGSSVVRGTVYAPTASLAQHGGTQIDGNVIAAGLTQGEPGDESTESRIGDYPFAATVRGCAPSPTAPSAEPGTDPAAATPAPSARTVPDTAPSAEPSADHSSRAGIQPRVVGGVVNGGFETSTLSGWTAAPTLLGPSAVTSPVHSGTYAASVGWNVTGSASISQTFTAPVNTTALTFWYDQTLCNSLSVDWATATLVNNTTSTTTTPLPKTCAASPPGWLQVTTPVIAGDSYTLTLMNANGGGLTDHSSTVFDDAETMGLAIAKTANVSSTTPGSTVTYTITATNSGQTTYTGAAFSDSLAGLLGDADYNNNASATTGSTSYSAPNLTWTGNLAIGATATITYSVTVNNPDLGSASLIDTVTSSTPGNNCVPLNTLGFLMSASSGPVTGTGAIHYTDGTTQSYTLTSPDWGATTAPTGGAVAANSAYQNRPGNTTFAHTTDIFSMPVALTAGKTVSYVVLPTVGTLAAGTPALHIFAIGGISHSSLASTFNDEGITNDTSTTPGSFDGTGSTFSQQALTTAGAAPGATITSSGLSFTFPNVSSDTNDNTVANGQTVYLAPTDTNCTSTVTDVVPPVLSITVPTTANLGSSGAGGTLSAPLGSVTVLDQRGLSNASWTASVSITSFTTGGATGPETITGTNVSYWSGPATSTTGSATVTPGQANAASAQPLGTVRTAFGSSIGNGFTTAAWNPTLVVAIPATAVAGTYTATVTHSVA